MRNDFVEIKKICTSIFSEKFFLRNSKVHNFFIDFPRNSEKKKSITVHAEKINLQGTACGANFIKSVSFISNLSLTFHNFWGIKKLPKFSKMSALVPPNRSLLLFRFPIKVVSHKFHKNSGICSQSLVFFLVFFSISS